MISRKPNAMNWCPQEGTTVLVVPIDVPDRYKRFKVDAFFQYHFMNAYETGNDIVVDFVHVSEFEAAYKGHNRENRLDRMQTGKATVSSSARGAHTICF